MRKKWFFIVAHLDSGTNFFFRFYRLNAKHFFFTFSFLFLRLSLLPWWVIAERTQRVFATFVDLCFAVLLSCNRTSPIKFLRHHLMQSHLQYRLGSWKLELHLIRIRMNWYLFHFVWIDKFIFQWNLRTGYLVSNFQNLNIFPEVHSRCKCKCAVTWTESKSLSTVPIIRGYDLNPFYDCITNPILKYDTNTVSQLLFFSPDKKSPNNFWNRRFFSKKNGYGFQSLTLFHWAKKKMQYWLLWYNWKLKRIAVVLSEHPTTFGVNEFDCMDCYRKHIKDKYCIIWVRNMHRYTVTENIHRRNGEKCKNLNFIYITEIIL